KMRGLTVDTDRRALLTYLNARFYGPLSAASHLSGLGLLAQAGMVLPDQDESMQRKYFSDQVLTAMTITFALISTLICDVVPERPLAGRAIALWATPNLWDVATELFQQQYEARLRSIAP